MVEIDSPINNDENEKNEILFINTLNELNVNTNATKKKKKKKKKDKTSQTLDEKKKGAIQDTDETSARIVDNSRYRLLGSWDTGIVQGGPLRDRYKVFPPGEVVEYCSSETINITDAEKRELENRVDETVLIKLREAAECHRQTRKYIQTIIKPGIKLIDMCKLLEAKSKELVGACGLECGWGFPTGCSLNNVAAHYTPNYGDDTVLKADDIMKLDFGVHVSGYIIDCAFTVAFDPKYDPLIQATLDGTNCGLKCAGVDVPLADLGEEIQEAIESYEIELNNKTIPIKPISNLEGHSIQAYQIHSSKSVPIVKKSKYQTRMEENEIFAIETFASTGRGEVAEYGECSHYMRNTSAPFVSLPLKRSKLLLNAIDKHFGPLAFCKRWLDDNEIDSNDLLLNSLIKNDLLTAYPPLCDTLNSYTSQSEHTIFIGRTKKEILSRGPDY